MMKAKTLRYLHRLAALMVGWQLLIWLGTGLYFNLTPHEKLKGTTYLNRAEAPVSPPLSSFSLQDPAALLKVYPSSEKLSLIWLDQRPYYLLTHRITRYAHQCQQQRLVDAVSGNPYQLTAADAIKLAKTSYSGGGSVIAATVLEPGQSEWPKQCNRLWQVQFDDSLQTRAYLDASSGQLIGHKNRHTDLSDWIFRLHFMDYLNQGSFNQPFAWLMALLSLGLLCSGGHLAIQEWRKKRLHNSLLTKANKLPS